MSESAELLSVKQASEWATAHTGKTVTPSNIICLISYGNAKVLRNAREFLAEDFDIFLVANDKYNLYPHLN